jgi:hypothetical protein
VGKEADLFDPLSEAQTPPWADTLSANRRPTGRLDLTFAAGEPGLLKGASTANPPIGTSGIPEPLSSRYSFVPCLSEGYGLWNPRVIDVAIALRSRPRAHGHVYDLM